MNTPDSEYFGVLRQILTDGIWCKNRTAYRSKKIFGPQMRFNLRTGFPLLTTKKLAWRAIVTELLWFLRGETNIRYLVERKNFIWTDWPCRRWLKETGQHVPNQITEEALWRAETKRFSDLVLNNDEFAARWGDCGPVYGYQWRHWQNPDGKTDQISTLIRGLRENPDGRRHIVNAWNVSDLERMDVSGLQPCHCLFQFYVADGKLSCKLYQRSADFFLGVPFNIASYSLLTMMVAQVCGYQPAEFIWTGGDCHIYENHINQVEEQLAREPRPSPRVTLNQNITDIFAFDEADIRLEGYDPHPAIRGAVAV